MPPLVGPGGAGDDFSDLLPRHLLRGVEHVPAVPPAQRWAYERELDHQLWGYEPGKIFLGYRNGHAVGRRDDRHIFLLAGSRGGKGVSFILPNAVLWPGSFLAIDPKGELARKTARARSLDLGQKVIVLDPFERSGIPSSSFNPLAEIIPPELADPTRLTPAQLTKRNAAAIDNAGLVADGLIYNTGGDAHWTDSAKELLKGLILYTLSLPDEADRNLVTVRELLTFLHPDAAPQPGQAPDQALIDALIFCSAFDDVVSGIGRSFYAKPERERGSIISEATTQTAFLDSPSLKNILRESRFRLRDLKRNPTSLYLCLPANRMGTHARWLRIIINMALQAFEEEPNHLPDAVLMCLDEFNILGAMNSISNAAGQMASFNVKLCIVLQDITQLSRHYEKSWETFVGNAGLFLAYANSDASTLEYISKKLGTISITLDTSTGANATATMAGAASTASSQQLVPLMAPHEVEQAFAREHKRMLVLYSGAKPIVVERSISHDDPNFMYRLDP